MKLQKLLTAVFAALVLLLAVAQVDSFAKLNGDVNDVIRHGKRIYEQPVADAAPPFVKVVYPSDFDLPNVKRFESSVASKFFARLIEVSYIGYSEFKDFVRPSRSTKFLETE